MSYAAKSNRPDSKDTARLRSEYEKKAAEFRDCKDPATKAKLKDDKQKSFQKVVEQMNGERAASLAEVHKVLIGMGRLKTPDQMNQERSQREGKQAQAIAREARIG